MKNLFLVLAILWAMSSTVCVFVILYNTEIRISYLNDNLVFGDPLINRNTHKIIFVNDEIVEYIEVKKFAHIKEWHTDNWAKLHEAVSGTTLSNPILRWASKLQKLMGKRLI